MDADEAFSSLPDHHLHHHHPSSSERLSLDPVNQLNQGEMGEGGVTGEYVTQKAPPTPVQSHFLLFCPSLFWIFSSILSITRQRLSGPLFSSLLFSFLLLISPHKRSFWRKAAQGCRLAEGSGTAGVLTRDGSTFPFF